MGGWVLLLIGRGLRLDRERLRLLGRSGRLLKVPFDKCVPELRFRLQVHPADCAWVSADVPVCVLNTKLVFDSVEVFILACM
ncbi:hypothetical protein V6N13_008291 [Hibiscus sabdariffa]